MKKEKIMKVLVFLVTGWLLKALLFVSLICR